MTHPGGRRIVPHGDNAKEFAARVTFGMAPLELSGTPIPAPRG